MGWLFFQTWIWLLVAFVVGAVIALLLAYLLFPNERDAFKDVLEGGRS
ncbi:hypothetical protein [Flexivirga meconopsidis]|nr:hypothetical protein [Flexivirga meconopsidis]